MCLTGYHAARYYLGMNDSARQDRRRLLFAHLLPHMGMRIHALAA